MKKASPWILTIGFSLLAFCGLFLARVIYFETVLKNGEPALVLSGRFRTILKSSMAGLCFLPGFLVTAFLTFGKIRGVRSAVAQTLGIGVLFTHSPPSPQRVNELHPWPLFGELSEFFAGLCLVLLVISIVSLFRSPKKSDYFRWNSWSLAAFLAPFLLGLWDAAYHSMLAEIESKRLFRDGAIVRGQYLTLYLMLALCTAAVMLFFTSFPTPEDTPAQRWIFGAAAGIALVILAYFLASMLSPLPLPKLKIDRERDVLPLILCGAAIGAACAPLFRKKPKAEILTSP